jgi:predicted nucleic acid-binding protein
VIVVADTSVLLNLAFLRLDHLLARWFGEVLVPEAVAGEFHRLSMSRGRFAGLKFPVCCVVKSVPGIPSQIASSPRLDAGEAEAMALVLEYPESVLLLDEVAARAVAASFSLHVVGTLGLLIRAKNDGFIPQVAPLLRQLMVEGQFRVSPALVNATLKRAGELF